MGGYRAAVDFGTSYTAAAIAGPAGMPTVLALVDEGRLASAVAVDNAGRVQAGPVVAEVAALAPDRVERTPKRCLDQPDIMLGGRPVPTVDLVAAVLGYVRDELLRQFNGADPEELCLTHPARWEAGEPRMQRLTAAAAQAGFPATSVLPEPCAAALALAAAGQLDGVGDGGLVAVYDLGGGTFDLALLSRAPDGGFVLVGEPGGDPELGGEWLDDRLLERLSGQLPPDDEASLRDPANSADPVRWQRAGYAFREGIRRAKERLSREASTQIALNPPFTLDHLTLSRAELERTATPLINKSADRIDLFLTRNGKAPADLDAICLVGGSSRLTVVNRILGQRFGRPIATHGDPKSVTALGALSTVQAIAPARETAAPEVPTVSLVGAEAPSSVTPAGAEHAVGGVPGDSPQGYAPAAASAAVAPEGTTSTPGKVAAAGPGLAGGPPDAGTRMPQGVATPAGDGETGAGATPGTVAGTHTGPPGGTPPSPPETPPGRSRKRWRTILIAGGAVVVVVVVVVVVLILTKKSPTTYRYSVQDTSVQLYSGPGVANFQPTRILHYGNSVDIVCQTEGQTMYSGSNSSAVWDKLVQGDYASDVAIDTPSKQGAFSPPIPRC